MSEKKGGNFFRYIESSIENKFERIAEYNADEEKIELTGLIPLEYQVDAEINFGKHFTIPDVPGYKTIVFEVYEAIDYKTLTRYFTCEVIDSEYQGHEDSSGGKTTYYIDDPQTDGNQIIIISFSAEKNEAFINNGILLGDEVKITRKPTHFGLTKITPEELSVISSTTHNIEKLSTDEISNLFKKDLREDERWFEAAVFNCDTIIIDPENAMPVKRELYYDETHKKWKARIKIIPYKSYFAFQIRNNDTHSLRSSLSYVEIARFYRDGKCMFPKDVVKAAEYFEKDGSAYSMYEIAALFRTDDTMYDEEIYMEYLNKAVKMGCEEALVELIIYQLFSSEINIEKYEDFLGRITIKAELREFIKGYFIEKGVLNGDMMMALRCYQEAADSGFDPAITRLDMRKVSYLSFTHPEGIEANKANQIAADYCMGCFLFFGLGIIPIKSKGLELLKKSAYQGDAFSIEALYCIFEVDSDYKDKNESTKWLKMLARIDSSYIVDFANRLIDGDGCEVSEENDLLAFDLLQKRANEGDSTAIHNLAWMYKKGRGCEVNYSVAMQLFKKAQKPNSFFHLGDMYENGLGILADFATAVDYYKKGAELGSEKAKKRLEEINMC